MKTMPFGDAAVATQTQQPKQPDFIVRTANFLADHPSVGNLRIESFGTGQMYLIQALVEGQPVNITNVQTPFLSALADALEEKDPAKTLKLVMQLRAVDSVRKAQGAGPAPQPVGG